MQSPCNHGFYMGGGIMKNLERALSIAARTQFCFAKFPLSLISLTKCHAGVTLFVQAPRHNCRSPRVDRLSIRREWVLNGRNPLESGADP